MIKKLPFCLLIIAFICFVGNAQDLKQQSLSSVEIAEQQNLTFVPDGVEEKMEALYQQFPEAKKDWQQQINALNSSTISKDIVNCSGTFSCPEVINIPIVFHILYGNNEYSAYTYDTNFLQNDVLDTVNEHYNPDGSLDDNLGSCYEGKASQGNCFNFCMARYNHPSNAGLSNGQVAVKYYQVSDATIENIADIGINSSNEQPEYINNIAPAWNSCEYLNVYIVPNILAPSSGLSTTGYAYLPNNAGDEFNSIYLDWDFIGLNSTLSHEIGHWLGLNHTWGKQIGCGNDDYYLDDENCPIEDTFPQSNSNISTLCPNASNACNIVSCSTPDNYYNLMNYSICPISARFFTVEQYCSMYYTLSGNIDLGCRNLIAETANDKCFDCSNNTVVTNLGTICEGTTINHNGFIYNASNTPASIEQIDENGCAYTEYIFLEEYTATENITETATFCQGSGSFYTSENGIIYNENNPNGTEVLQDENNCPYLLTVNLTYESCATLGAISSVVFSDENENGTQETNEQGIEGIEVFIVNPDGTIDIRLTNNDGTFTFDELAAGTYEIFVSNNNGLSNTSPLSFLVGLSAGETYFNNGAVFGFSPQISQFDCTDFLVDYYAQCINDDTAYEIVVSVTGFDTTNGYTVASPNPAINGNVYYSGAFQDGPYPVETGFDYTIYPTNHPTCTQNISVSAFSCTTTAVELISFDATVLDTANKLTWQVASEINNDFYTLESSDEGLHFSKLAKINAQNTQNNYSYLDFSPKNNTTYYRLKATDKFGKTEIISNIIKVERKQSNFEIYPIPSTDILNISFEKEILSDVVINIFNIEGKLLKQVFKKTKNEHISLNINDLNTGIYWIQIEHSGVIQSAKFIKQ